MSLLQDLIARSNTAAPHTRRVVVRVLLDEAGRVHDVVVKHSCGDADADAQAAEFVRQMHFSRTRLGSKGCRRWHDLACEVPLKTIPT